MSFSGMSLIACRHVHFSDLTSGLCVWIFQAVSYLVVAFIRGKIVECLVLCRVAILKISIEKL